MSPLLPSNMGWRYWSWSPSRQTLCSPMYRTVWREPELWARNWDIERGHGLDLRDVCGIHAALAPVEWWKDKSNKEINEPGTRAPSFSVTTEVDIGEILQWEPDEVVITGLVMRKGKYLLGTKGWRAQLVIIQELLAPTNKIGLQLEAAFPDIHVRYMDPEVFPDENEPMIW